MADRDTAAIRAVAGSGIPHRIIEHGPVASLEEAARRRGVDVRDVLKSLVVRIGPDQYVMVLVPGDRVIDWPKLRALLSVSRMSLAPAEEAEAVTGYPPGAITPFGCRRHLPVVVDSSAVGEVSVGGGEHGVAIHLDVGDLVRSTTATVGDVTRADGQGGGR